MLLFGGLSLHAFATGQQYYLIPTEDEWYKAAYYTGSSYSLYADGTSDTNSPPSQPDGTTPYTGWNYYDGDFALSLPNYTWTVDSGTEEQNGTLNMMGNVREWNEALIGENRGLRGGSYYSNENDLRASNRYNNYPTDESSNIGFRVASIIPEPGSVTMLLAGAVGLLLWRRRRTA